MLCSTNSTSPRTARWSSPANISKWSSPKGADPGWIGRGGRSESCHLRTHASSFDHLVGAAEQRDREGEAPDGADVGSLRIWRHVADRHVIGHALPQR